ncbi:unnamed protein product [Didymodactylos carnosus]|uniref:Uncharacterized protein n=1 Tax=Didymodactylos carnosus TaxID=1234261 RepID=A0A813S2J1_9BILA|nr:unnamed protein product [Didymodactylos carnosus]CAF3574660.1 unnamed protein product [Didymodactylos carnosus]
MSSYCLTTGTTSSSYTTASGYSRGKSMNGQKNEISKRPPVLPPPEGTTVIDKIIPPLQKPPRQLIVEQYPPLPPKPQDVIIERWLPLPPRQRKILYERLPPSNPPRATPPIIIQHGQPNVRVVKEVITNTPPTQSAPHHLSPSSLFSYSPYSTMQPTTGYNTAHHPQSDVIVLQGGAQHTLPSSSYAIPMTCVVNNQNALSSSLGAYRGGTSTFPMATSLPGQSSVYHVPDNVPIESVLRQLGIDPTTLQRSSHYPSHLDQHTAVQHVWNAALHAQPQNTSAAHHVWDNIEHYLHPQHGGSSPVRSVWDHITHPDHYRQQQQSHHPPPPSNYPPAPHPPPPSNYPPAPHPPPSSYPPSSNYHPPPSSYPPPSSSYPPPSSNYHPPPSSYPPPPSSYPPPSSSYPPPSSNYPPPRPSNYPPPPSNRPPPSPQNYPPPYNQGTSSPPQQSGGGGIGSLWSKLAGH